MANREPLSGTVWGVGRGALGRAARTRGGSWVPRPSEFPSQLWSPSLPWRLPEPGLGARGAVGGMVTFPGLGSGDP